VTVTFLLKKLFVSKNDLVLVIEVVFFRSFPWTGKFLDFLKIKIRSVVKTQSWHLAGDLRVVGLDPSWNFRQSLSPDCRKNLIIIPSQIPLMIDFANYKTFFTLICLEYAAKLFGRIWDEILKKMLSPSRWD